jgi:hypothetical protein
LRRSRGPQRPSSFSPSLARSVEWGVPRDREGPGSLRPGPSLSLRAVKLLLSFGQLGQLVFDPLLEDLQRPSSRSAKGDGRRGGRLAGASPRPGVADAGNLIPSTNRRPPMYCNRADTHWYTMDKVIPPDHRKPPKQAQFPDASGRARTPASKLVMRRSAVRVRSSAVWFYS